MVSMAEICFGGIQEYYRNSVVRHIRTTLKTKYPDSWQDKLRAPFKEKEWTKFQDDAKSSRESGTFGSSLRDDVDLLSVNHFHNLFDKYFDDLFPKQEDASDRGYRQKRQNILGWAREVKSLRDPAIGHPAESGLTKEDAIRILDSARRITSFFDAGVAEELRKRMSDINYLTDDDVEDYLDDQRVLEGSTLPPRESIAPKFVGREAELDELDAWLRDPDSKLWLLAGDGGKGKSAIAYEFAVSTRNSSPPDSKLVRVIWLSAKARQFVSGQFVDIESPDFYDLDSALGCVLRAYGAPDRLFEESVTTEDKKLECRDYLNELPSLIILDDVDSLEGKNTEAMNFFIQNVGPTPSKLLLTSRRMPFFGMEAFYTPVNGFVQGSDEGTTFINSRISMFGLNPEEFSSQNKNRIIEACDGSPLFIQDLLRLCATGEPTVAAINRWKNSLGEDARKYALGREFDMLSEQAQEVLLTCALFPGAASLADVQAAAEGIPDKDCALAIEELQRLFLVPLPELVEDIPRFRLNLNTRQLVKEVRGDSDMARRIQNKINGLLVNVRFAPSQIKSYVLQAFSLVDRDKHDEAEETLKKALDHHRDNAELRSRLGWVYKNWKPLPRYTDACEQFDLASQLKSSSEDTYWHWADLEYRRREWTSSAQVAERGLALENLRNSEKLSYMAGRARYELVKDLFRQALYSRAEQEARTAQAHLENALALKDLEHVERGQYRFHSNIHRTTVLNFEYSIRIVRMQDRFSQFRHESNNEKRFLRLLARSLGRWRNEHPSDDVASSETERLIRLYPTLSDYIEIPGGETELHMAQ